MNYGLWIDRGGDFEQKITKAGKGCGPHGRLAIRLEVSKAKTVKGKEKNIYPQMNADKKRIFSTKDTEGKKEAEPRIPIDWDKFRE